VIAIQVDITSGSYSNAHYFDC